jgi:hypothetical protein
VVVVGVTLGAIARDPSRVLGRIETAYVTARSLNRRADVAATPRIVPVTQALGSHR